MRLVAFSSLSLLVSSCCSAPPPAPPLPPPAPVVVLEAPKASAETVRRAVVVVGRTVGTSVATRSSDGTMTVAFDVRENGRGPKTDATIRLAPDGTIASLDAKGHHEMQAPLAATFSMDGHHAEWKSIEEEGEATVMSPAFFIPLAEIPDVFGLLAQALLRAGGTLPLLPRGRAQIEKVGDATVRGAAGEKHLIEYDITGLDFTPTPVWMEEDGSWFGIVDPITSVVPEGWEPAIEQLVTKQVAFERARDADIAKRLGHHPPRAGVAFTHARVLDVEAGRWQKDQTVVVVGDRIRALGPTKNVKVPAGAEIVDLAGKALLPGLWDMHAHLGRPDGALDIASGVTTARDVGNDPDRLDDFKARFDEGTAIGPHVLRAGFIEGRGVNAASSKITAMTPEEARAGVRFYADRGYEMMKIYNSIPPELVPIITKEAHARGMTVTGHIPAHMLAHEAVRAGYDGIEHMNMLLLNFFADHDTDTRTPVRFSLVGERGASFDLTSKPAEDFFALLREHHTVIDPTLATFEYVFEGRQGKLVPGTERWVARLPIQAQRGMLVGGLPSAGKEEAYDRAYEKMIAMVGALRDAKVTLVAGTDDIAGLTLDHELELFVRGGLSPAEALRDATIVPARVMKKDKTSGSIAVGKVADLAVVDGDPLTSIADVYKVETTVRSGVMYLAKDVTDTVGVAYWR